MKRPLTRRFAPTSPRARGEVSRASAQNKKAGIAPGLFLLIVDGRVIRAKTRFALLPGHDDVGRPQFEARFGGEAGHDLIRVS
jgi:hypothetical protein